MNKKNMVQRKAAPMKKKNMVQWKTAPVSTDAAPATSNVVYFVMLLVLQVLTIYAGCSMLYDVFPSMTLNITTYLLLAVLALAISLMGNFAQKPKATLRIAAFVFAGIYVWFGIRHWQEIVDGIGCFLQAYFKLWNKYYHTNIPDFTANILCKELGLGYAVLLLTTLLSLLCARFRKPFFLILFPVLILILELMIGEKPDWPGVACLFACVLLASAKQWQRQKSAQQLPLLIGMLLTLLLLVTTVFHQPARFVVDQEKEMLAFQKDMENKILLSIPTSLFTDSNAIDNHAPHYQNKEVMSLRTDFYPEDNLYLADSHGVDYSNRHWSEPDSSFAEACAAHDITEADAAALLAQLGYNTQKRLQPAAFFKTDFQIFYTGISGAAPYLPYNSNVEELRDSLSFTGDFLSAKKERFDQLSFTGSDSGIYSADSSVYFSDYEMTSMLDTRERAFCDWYNDYVLEHYLTVPEDQTAVQAVASSLRLQPSISTYIDESEVELSYIRNEVRIFLANTVAAYLNNYAQYSLDLDPLDSSTDPVDYFLSTSHKGYCVHFASAGVLILRELGVPCRYTSGYVAKQSLFKDQDTDYVCSIEDNCAHAWAEIYLDDYGWMPVDMTPGYTTVNPGTSALVSDVAANTDTTSQPDTDVTASDPDTNSPEDTSTVGAEIDPNASDTSNGSADGSDSSGNEDAGINGSIQGLPGSENESGTRYYFDFSFGAHSGSGSVHGLGPDSTNASRSQRVGPAQILMLCQFLLVLLRPILPLLLAILTLILLLVSFFLIRRQRQARLLFRIRHCIKKEQGRTAITLINQDLYRKLARSRHRPFQRLDDAAYEKALADAYPQITASEWNKFMILAQKAAFAPQRPEPEEAAYAFSLYKRALQKNTGK